MAIRPIGPERLCIHQVTLMQCDFATGIDSLARGGVGMTAVWREKLEAVGVSNARRILSDAGVRAVSLCPGGLFAEAGRAGLDRYFEQNTRWIELASEIGAASMVTITGGLPDDDLDLQAARERVVEGLARILPVAKEANVKLALEPLHPMVHGIRSIISTLDEALDILDLVGAGSDAGVALDTYALWWDSRLLEQITRAGSRILNFHVSDWLRETADVRLDRGMPGDGLIDNRQIRAWVEQHGFAGPVEVELFSTANWWQRDPDEVVSTIVGRLPKHI